MGQWQSNSVAQAGEAFIVGHDHILVLTAMIIAILAASVLIPCIERYRSSRSVGAKLGWVLVGAFAMGCGLWGMHVTNLLALDLPVSIGFDPLLLALSAVPTVVASALTIAVCKAPIHPPARVYIAALGLGLGIMAMYHMSLEAIVAPVHFAYDTTGLVMASVGTVATLWLGLNANVLLILRMRNHWSARVLGSIIFGCAGTAANFVIASAVSVYPDASFNASVAEVDGRVLSLAIAAIVTALVGLSTMATVVDRRIALISRFLDDSESRFRTLAETSACAIFTFDKAFIYANPALAFMTGYSDEALRFMSPAALFGESLYCRLQELDRRPGGREQLRLEQEVEIRHRNGESRWIYLTLGSLGNDNVGYVGSAFDITERKRMESRLRHLAYHDSLTDLPNRLCFLERLQQRLEHRAALSHGDPCPVLSVNLGRLKWINDSFGQAAGDELLRDLSRELRQLLTADDLLARVGGHEFAILLSSAHDLTDARDTAEGILQLFARPYSINKQEIQLRCQVGIALAVDASPSLTADADAAAGLLQQAYIAMNRARSQNSNSFCVFDQAMREKAAQRLQLESDLNRALLDEQFELYYQPIVSLPDGDTVYGFESLIRWPRGDGTFVSPGEFIPVAEETGLIAPLGDWILQAACRQLATWNRSLGAPIYLSVNISSLQLFQPHFVSKLAALVEEHHIAPGQLKLELTESVLVEDGPGVLRTMDQLLSLGCEIMIDDFGTGYSSLSYLARFPASIIKIDQSFIQNIGPEDLGAPIIKAIVSLARDLGMGVVAEGIETEHAAHILQVTGCEAAQGFLFSRPLPAHEATLKLLEAFPLARSGTDFQ